MKFHDYHDTYHLQCFILDSPIEVLNHPLAKVLFPKLCQLKVEGFDILNSKYLALDQNDFLATHFIICDTTDNNVTPLMAFKVMSQDQSEYWKVPFSGEIIADRTTSDSHKKAVGEFFDQCKVKKNKVAYPGSMTISPKVRKRSLRLEMIKIFQAILAFYHTTYYKSYSICIARSKVKSENFLQEMGFHYFLNSSDHQQEVQLPQYLDEPFKIMYIEEHFSLHAYRMMQRYSDIIKSRVVISANESNLLQKEDHNYLPFYRSSAS